MDSALDPATCTWQMGWPGRVSRHDVVYLSPPGDPMQGLPIGNGDVGVLCWCEASTLILAINKCDLWDDASFGRFHNWRADEEEHSTTLRHAGRIVVDFRMPVFDLLYLADFRGRIGLADATLSLAASGPLGSVSFTAFVSHDEGLICCELETDLEEQAPTEIRVERYGSRTFSHWYSLVNRDARLGLGGTSASADEDGAYVTQELTGGRFGLGLSVVNGGGLEAAYAREHAHCARVALSGATRKRCTLLAAVTDCLPVDPVPALKQKLAAARATGATRLRAAHEEAWKSFWRRSLMEYGDDYLDSLWHLAMYYANASQRGTYPGRFIHGLWGWNRDVQPWCFYFHWNQQQTYWPLNAAGHHDLLRSYLDYRFHSLPHAQEDARDLFDADGAYVSDVSERRGYNSASESLNHTPVAQIAMDLWRQYRFTGDASFLRDRALPYLLEAAKFFESRLERGKDGRYHAKEATGYEGWIRLKDCISELVCARVLFAAALEALREAGVEEPRAEKWAEILDALAPLPIIEAGDDFLAAADGAFELRRGPFSGDAADSDQLLAAGFGIQEGRLLTSFVPSGEPSRGRGDRADVNPSHEGSHTPCPALEADLKCNDGIFPWVEFSAVFPSGLIGLAGEHSPLFRAAVNTVKLFGDFTMGWDPVMIAMARLGLARELAEILERWPGRWQLYCNGFGHYGPSDGVRADADLRFRTNPVQDASLPEAERGSRRFPFPTWPFRHMGMESMSVLACAMNESLLQSHDGIIRVAPAAAAGQQARFTLHAQDGFVVSAEIRAGRPLWIAIESRLGKTCRLANPWPTAWVYANGSQVACGEQRVVEFATARNGRYVIVPDEEAMASWETGAVEYPRNEAPKVHASGCASLGLPRMF